MTTKCSGQTTHNGSKAKEGLGLSQVQNEDVTVKMEKMEIIPGRRIRAKVQSWKSAMCISDTATRPIWFGLRASIQSDKTRLES